MEGGEATSRAIIEDALARMHAGPTHNLTYEVLQGGISGAYTYRLHLADRDAVLKIVLPDASPGVLQRAHREVSFYGHLASHVPVRVPAVLGWYADTDAVALLLAAHRPAPPAHVWTEHQYLEIADELARLHAKHWNATGALPASLWLLPAADTTSAETVRQALVTWHEVAKRPLFAGSPGELQWIYGMLARIEDLDAIIQCLPTTLCHGDCHSENLLRDSDGSWVWADWQEVRLGRGPEDLSFFFQRARAAGGTVPEDAAITMYCERLAADTSQPISVVAVRRVVGASELRTQLLHWPPFLTHFADGALAAFLRRMHDVAARLDVGLNVPAQQAASPQGSAWPENRGC